MATALRATWQHGIHARDEAVELPHVVLQEFSRSFVGNLTILGNQAGLELNVRLDRIHLWRITER